jgi:hypothetical protein
VPGARGVETARMEDYVARWREEGSTRPYAGYVCLGERSAQLVGRAGGGPRWVVSIRLEHIQSVSLSNETLRIVRRHGPAIEIQSDDSVEALRELAERLAARVSRSVFVTLEAA